MRRGIGDRIRSGFLKEIVRRLSSRSGEVSYVGSNGRYGWSA